MAAPPKHQARFVFEIDGEADRLDVVRFTLRESISALFELDLDIATSNRELDLAALIRRPAQLTILGLHDEDVPRFVHGIIHSASQGRQDAYSSHYHLRIVPRVWPLLHRRDCRIFQARTTQQIVQEVLRGAGVANAAVRFNLAEALPTREYCVQYRESDWDFVRRLLEEDGLSHFFTHQDGDHTLVIADGPAAHPNITGAHEVLFNDADAVSDQDAVRSFRFTEQLGPGKATLRDFNFATPDDGLEAAASGTADDLEVYDYPGRHDSPALARRAAKLRLQALQATQRRGEGTSVCPRLTPGHTFALKEYAGALRLDLQQEYLVIRVVHTGEQAQALDGGAGGERYSNEFVCIPASVPYRPPLVTTRPEIRGVQTAIVVGPGGEEVHTDEHGRVKVQFHWDRRGKRDEGSSCWVRVSQAWAGQGYGSMWIPRIGHEVIVDFLEGDPDRPIITGRVYHGNNAPPYPLPDEKTRSTIKSDSSPGGGGSNELRFEDAKGREELYLHAQKDLTVATENDKNQTVGHDETLQVGHDRGLKIGHDQRETIGNDRTISVGANHGETIGASMTISVAAELAEQVGGSASFTVGGSKSETVAIASTETVGAVKALTIGAAYQVSVGAAMNESIGLAKMEEIGLSKLVMVGQDSAETVGGTRSINAGANVSASAAAHVMISAGQNMNLSAGKDLRASVGKSAGVVVADKLTIAVGSATVTIKKNGDITIQGGKLSIKASGQVTVKGSKIKLN
jgi:type VI secretion system secreted protein VgrG